MNILRLFFPNKIYLSWNILYVTILAGLANSVLLALVNLAAERTYLNEVIGAQTILLYVIAFAIFYVANQASLNQANHFLHERLNSLRNRIATKIQRADLRSLERIEHGEIYSVLSGEMNHFSHHFTLLASAAQSSVLLVLCLAYIAFLSFTAFIVVFSSILVALLYFWMRRSQLTKAMTSVNAKESHILETLNHYTSGFQEVRLHSGRSDSLHDHFQKASHKLETLISGIGGKWVVLLLFSNAFLYALVGVVVFILPLFFSGYTDTIYKVVTASIFIVGPIASITSAAPIFVKANIGLGHVFDLETRLEQGLEFKKIKKIKTVDFNDFKSLRFDSINFRYSESLDGFQVGPWSFEIARGECVFFTGGNGSGKSTALKLICGLYQARNGKVFIDQTEIVQDFLPEYRHLFSSVFSDFYLFDQLYGLDNISIDKVNSLISWMELTDKVHFENHRFSTLDLSVGQRKRLALIVSLLENRPILLLDEWAADQDAYFREKFYVEILPELKRMGKTIFVITHDEKYWHTCDRMFRFELGKLQCDVQLDANQANGGRSDNY